jgi:hypothetical protein
MKKVLCLLFITSPLFSMELAVRNDSHRINHFNTTKFNEKAIDCNYVKPSADHKVRIEPSSVFVPEKLGSLELYHHDKKGFVVRQDDKKYIVKKYFTDSMVRDITKKQLKSFLEAGYFSINQMEDGQFSLKAKGRVNGGGALGAAIGAFLGKAAVSVVGHGAIQIVALCTGPAYLPTVFALESCFGAQIEAASIQGAIAGGIALGVATGPV